jgi:hypothetical protein
VNLTFTPAEEAFRRQVRGFFEDEYPRDILDKLRNGDILDRADHIRSQRALQSRGWLAIGWPQNHGGAGLDGTRRYVFEEEMDRAGVPHLLPMAMTAQRITELYVELAGRGTAPWPDRRVAGWRELTPDVPDLPHHGQRPTCSNARILSMAGRPKFRKTSPGR